MKLSLLLSSGLLTIFLLSPTQSWADGKFYTTDPTPTTTPYQRAIIIHTDDNVETLILQSKYSGKGNEFGWVIPLPSKPRLGAMWWDQIFWELMRDTPPKVVLGRWAIFFFLLVGCIAIGIWLREKEKRELGCLVMLPALFIFAIMVSPRFGDLPPESVQVIGQARVGIYDVTTIKAQEAGPLIEWLNEHKFHYTKEDEEVFSHYIKKGWCFVTSRLNPKFTEQELVSRSGLVQPLIMIFESKDIVYPLKITSLTKEPSEILLYVYSDHKVASPKFNMEFAGEDSIRDRLIKTKIDPADLFKEMQFPSYLSKLRANLDPSEMEDDLILTPAKDDKPFRKKMIDLIFTRIWLN